LDWIGLDNMLYRFTVSAVLLVAGSKKRMIINHQSLIINH